ncbi:glycosyltransferase family 4 protein [Acholeplasma hippikon]|uniref:Spore coat protein SA n=1 Tax=Acholeplasma hippikon TaxID=264636 RepID=A0A449BLH4_9MOLU|nr:glycosyltransferase family 4 protein [Acholeplasma hippikon]VEU83283.1 Spore coat protein SA [Acholeplasma hippikon]
MKKVAFFVNHELVIYNFRKEIVKKFLDENYDVYIISPKGKKIDLLIELGAKHIDIDIDRHGINPLKDIYIIKKIKKILRNLQPDYLFTFTIKPNIYGSYAAKKLKIPHSANITGLGTAVEKPGLLQKITLIMYKVSFSNINTVFFQNEDNLNFFRKYKIALNKHILLPGSGVNLEEFSLEEYPNNDVIKFAFISRIMKEKGIDQFLDVASRMKNEKKAEFHVYGFCEDSYENKLKILTEEGIINYHGMTDNVKEVLKKIDCLIHPTYYPEGISNILLESLAIGRPIITTNRPGCKEVVDDGINGYMIEPESSNMLFDSVQKFLSLDKKERSLMGINGRKKVEAYFDRKIVVEKYLEEVKK